MELDLIKAREFYSQMLLIRRFEERCVELYSNQKIRGFFFRPSFSPGVFTGAPGRIWGCKRTSQPSQGFAQGSTTRPPERGPPRCGHAVQQDGKHQHLIAGGRDVQRERS